MLETVGPSLTLSDGFKYMAKVFPIQQSIRPLQNHNLVTVDRLNGLIKIHRVLQDSVATRLSSTQKVEAFDIIVQLLHEVFPTEELAEREGFHKVCETGDKFYPHVIAVLSKYHSLGRETPPSAKFNDLLRRFFW